MMEFIVIGTDRPDSSELRQRLRLAHLEYVADRLERFRFAGPILSDDGRPVGSLLILAVDDREALDAYLSEDPYFRSGLFETVSIRRTRQIVPEIAPGILSEEIERQRLDQGA
jgi:uncharacterized protein